MDKDVCIVKVWRHPKDTGYSLPVGYMLFLNLEDLSPEYRKYFMEASGQGLEIDYFLELFQVFGFTYGGSIEEGYFRLPDTRGFLKGEKNESL